MRRTYRRRSTEKVCKTVKTGKTNKEGQTGHEGEQAGKVIRIPRDWFGPRDELVPFGPRASQAEAGRVERPEAPLDPNSFWDESSNSIQDVVGAVGESANGGAGFCTEPARGELRAMAGRLWCAGQDLPGRIGLRNLAAGVVVLLVIGLGAAGWLWGQARPRASRPRVAAVSTLQERLATPSGAVVKSSDRRAVEARRKPHSGPSTSRPHVVSVVYRASQPSASSQTSVSYSPPSSHTSAAAETSNGTTGSGASAASTVIHSSQPAFGPGGALGPMSSPDG